MLKHTLLLILAYTFLVSCSKEEKKDYATVSGKIINHNGTDGSLQYDKYNKIIKISDDGTFSDTIHLNDKGREIVFSDGNEYTKLYLKNGDDVHLSLDTKEFDETLKFTGKGAENCNFLAKSSLIQEAYLTQELITSPKNVFSKKITELIQKLTANLDESKGLDKSFIEQQKESFIKLKEGLISQYDQIKKQKEAFLSFKGKPSPDFVNYENVKGGKSSLKDFKGKYIYIDVWATWCAPCKAEIPYLKDLEKDFHNKNIVFISISVDEGRGYKDHSLELAKKGWKKMIKDQDMKGVQLFADNAWKSDFVKAYKINGIPRFIIIDPQGNVIDANASRPSSPKTKELLNKLLK